MEEVVMPKEHQARWYDKLDNAKAKCQLCPNYCVISPGRSGKCKIRENRDGELVALSYGYPVAMQVDPIEKKPLAKFMPGTRTFSLGTFGCNLNCIFCQNHHLSRGCYDKPHRERYVSPEGIIDLALKHDCKSVAFTYNEPTVFGEYVYDVAVLAKKQGLATVLVTNGYITLDAAKDIYPLIDAANIDMKGFSEDFYRDMTGVRLHPVLEAVKYFYSLGHHLELTNLVIPNKNDFPEMIVNYLDWVGKNLDKQVPLHFSAYHPDYQYHSSPRTPPETLYRIRSVALERGFGNVFLGNIR